MKHFCSDRSCFQGKEYSVIREMATARNASLFGTNWYCLSGFQGLFVLERLPIVHTHDPGLQGSRSHSRFLVILGTELQILAGAAHMQSFLLSCHGVCPGTLQGQLSVQEVRFCIWRVIDTNRVEAHRVPELRDAAIGTHSPRPFPVLFSRGRSAC